MHVGPERKEVQLRHLLVGDLGELGSPVTDVGQKQPRQSVDVALAAVVEDVRSFSALDDRQIAALLQLREVDPQMFVGQLDELFRCVLRSHRDPLWALRAVPERRFGPQE